MLKPSDFTDYPWNSVSNNSQTETIAQNIMIILMRTGDNFRELDWKDYSAERKKDENFSAGERPYFDHALKYCKSSETAVLFSKTWAKKAGSKAKGIGGISDMKNQDLYWHKCVNGK